MGKILLVASGKGGAGKSSFCAGAASALALMGDNVLVIDGDAGMRNLDILLAMTDKVVFSFADVAKGVVPLSKAAAASDRIPGLWLLTAPGMPELPGIPYGGIETMMAEAAGRFDWVFVDCPAGLGGATPLFAPFAHVGIVIATPDEASLRGAEQMAASLFLQGVDPVRLVVNRVRPKLTRKGFAKNIDDAMDYVGLPLLGVIPEDEKVIIAASKGTPVTCGRIKGAAKAYFNIAQRMKGRYAPLMRM